VQVSCVWPQTAGGRGGATATPHHTVTTVSGERRAANGVVADHRQDRSCLLDPSLLPSEGRAIMPPPLVIPRLLKSPILIEGP
jgi:hypothetical protein